MATLSYLRKTKRKNKKGSQRLKREERPEGSLASREKEHTTIRLT